ncbi:MAG: TonB-dependent receptor [Proteobacteria bacterium]|nr:TonB-dependent receptor [Pseudomonadota bacterium]
MAFQKRFSKRPWAIATCALLGVPHATALGQSSPAATSKLDEVIVTARKREESLQEVPIAINVMTSEFLENSRIDDVQSALIRVPGIGFGQPMKSYTPIAIRGASTQDDSIGVDPNVAIFVDGVNVGSTTSIEFDLLDLERVEVLKGPQGTTFGRNTNGGVINYVTRKPDANFRAGISATLGNFERMEASGFVNGAIAENVSGSFSIRTRNTGGYVRNLTTGNMLGQDKVSTARGKLLFTPTDKLEVLFAADWMVDNSYGIPRYFQGPRPDNLAPSAKFSNDFSAVAQDLDGGYNRVGKGLSMTVTYETPFGTLHSISAVRDFDGKLFNFDFDAVDGRTTNGLDTTEGFLYQNTTLHSLSQEVRLDWRIGKNVDVTSGLYYLDEDQYRIEHLAASGLVGSAWRDPPPDGHGPEDLPQDILDQTINTKSFALFSDARFHVTDKATISAGVRWSDDKKSGSTQCWAVGAFFCADVYKTGYSASWAEPSWRLSFDYKATDNVMGYMSVARGYKSGGFSNSASGDGPAAYVAPLLATPYKPEFSISYEAGLRMQFADRRLTVNPTLFYVKYTDIQFLFLKENSNSFISGNIGGATNKGLELDVDFRASKDLTLWASYAYQNSEYTAGLAYDVPIIGHQLELTPKSSFTCGFDFKHGLGNGRSISFSGDLVEKSVQYDDATNDPLASTAFKGLVNLRIGYAPSEKTEVALWVNNALDKRNALGTNELGYFIYSSAQLAADPAAANSTQRTYTAPRSYGVTANWKF